MATRESILSQMQAGDTAAAQARIDSEMIPASTTYLDAIDLFEASLLADMEAASPLLAADATSTRTLTLAMTALAVVLGGLLSWMITRSIVGPMRRAIAHTQRVAGGDLTQSLNGNHQRSEIGQLETALGGMQGTLQQIVGRIRAATEGVATASSQIASAARICRSAPRRRPTAWNGRPARLRT